MIDIHEEIRGAFDGASDRIDPCPECGRSNGRHSPGCYRNNLPGELVMADKIRRDMVSLIETTSVISILPEAIHVHDEKYLKIADRGSIWFEDTEAFTHWHFTVAGIPCTFLTGKETA